METTQPCLAVPNAGHNDSDLSNRGVALVSLEDVLSGTMAPIHLMVCRQWALPCSVGKGTVQIYIASDQKGKIIQMVLKRKHDTQSELLLEDGHIYIIDGYTVVPAHTYFTNWNMHSHHIKLGVDSTAIHAFPPTAGFVRHPFLLTPLEETHADPAKRVVDVVGLIGHGDRKKPTRLVEKVLYFEIMNERGTILRTMLDTQLCVQLLKKEKDNAGPFFVLLTEMSPKEYGGHPYLVSTRASVMLTARDIPNIADLHPQLRAEGLPPLEDHSLSQAVYLGRLHETSETKETVTVNCLITITKIRNDTPWYYFVCNSCHSKTKVVEVGPAFWCGRCESLCEKPIPRLRLMVDVTDKMTNATIEIPNDIAEPLISIAARTVIQEARGRTENDSIPQSIEKLLNSTHVFQLKTNTYCDHGAREGFTCSAIFAPQAHPPLGIISTGCQEGLNTPYVVTSPLLIQKTETVTKFRDGNNGKQIVVDHSLSQALYLGRAHRTATNKANATLNCLITVANIIHEKKWYYYTCGVCDSTRGVHEVGTVVWCSCCEAICKVPIPRLHLLLDVADQMSTVAVTVADAVAETLIGKTVAALITEAREQNALWDLPSSLKNIVNTTHVFEIKINTYFDHGIRETFMCSAVMPKGVNNTLGVTFSSHGEHSVNNKETQTSGPPPATTAKKNKRNDGASTSRPAVKTPAKKHSGTTRIIVISSDEE